jgi:release factor glutamine methyltransferase
MTLTEALAWATQRIGAASDSPRQDAEILLAHQLGLSRGQLFTRLREPLRAADAEAFEELVARRVRQLPVAYLTGEKGFWTLTLKVTPAVLVPRPETELLVEWGLEVLGAPLSPGEGLGSGDSGQNGPHHLPDARPSPVADATTSPGGRDKIRIADLGTGSGAIALALASERPEASVTATDASHAALEVARGNAADLGLERVQFRQGHWCEPLQGGRFDLIVSNPPYIRAGDDHLPALRHEPLSALTDGADGLQCLREIVATAPALLRPGGWLLLEHGYDQGEAVRGLLKQAGLADIATRRDLGGQERATGARKP